MKNIEPGFADGNLICCAKYDPKGTLAKLVTRMKYGGVSDVVEVFQPFLRIGAKKLIEKISYPKMIIVPVPIGKNRMKQRGFNQAEILAESLALCLKEDHGCEVEIQPNLLQKIDRPKQSTLGRAERLKNLKGAITLAAGEWGEIHNQVVVVIDDVATTLSTLNECKKAIGIANPLSIYFVVLARAKSL